MQFSLNLITIAFLGCAVLRPMPLEALARSDVPAGSPVSGSRESRTGPWGTLPGRTSPVASPDGSHEVWVEGWTTLPGGAGPLAAEPPEAEFTKLEFRARLVVRERRSQARPRTVAVVGPAGSTESTLYQDLEVVGWSADSRSILCLHRIGVPFSDVVENSLLVTTLEGSLTMLSHTRMVHLCEEAGLHTDPHEEVTLTSSGFTGTGEVLLEFIRPEPPPGSVPAGSRAPDRFAYDLSRRTVLALKTPRTDPAYGSPGTLRDRGVFQSPEEESAFQSLVGPDYPVFSESFQLISEEADEDGLGATVRAGAVRGLLTVMESIIMTAPGGRTWAACIDPKDSRVKYFTSVPEWRTRLPRTIEAWRERFKDMPVTFVTSDP